MKKYLTLLLILPVFCFGQKKDSVAIISKWTGATYATPANGIGMTITGVQTSSEPKQDTIQAIFLVCDTLKRPIGMGSSDGGQIYSTTPDVWWKPGFMVYEMQWGSIPCNSGNSTIATTQACFGWYREKFITHLDRRKKPLDSWIVVWQVKEIN